MNQPNGLFMDQKLFPIYDKVMAQQRLDFDDGLTLYQTSDLLGLGHLANLVRERLHGAQTFYIYNQHINYSNICINGCRFCAFGKTKQDPQAYEMSLEEIFAKVQERLAEPISELHIVGGLYPGLYRGRNRASG